MGVPELWILLESVISLATSSEKAGCFNALANPTNSLFSLYGPSPLAPKKSTIE